MYQKPEPSRVPGPALKAGYVVSRRALDRYLVKGVRDRSDAIDRVRLRGQSFCPLDKLQPDKTWQGGTNPDTAAAQSRVKSLALKWL